MKTYTFLLFLLSNIYFCFTINAQQSILPSKFFENFTELNNQKPIGNTDILLEYTLNNDNFYTIALKYDGQTQEFKLKPITYPSFYAKFRSSLYTLLVTVSNVNGDKKPFTVNSLESEKVKSLDNLILAEFAKIVTYYNSEEERPQVATIKLKSNEVPVFHLGHETPLKNRLSDISVEISFFGGFIEKIQVNGKIDEEEYSFNNKFSIGISSTKNIQQLADYRLFSNERVITELSALDSLRTISSDPVIQRNAKNKKSLYIWVDDVVRYIKKVDVNANDISPVPQVILLDTDNAENKLYREESSKLFEAVAYTDLIGLFDEENPNGLVQLEVKKRFNINTRMYDRPGYYGIIPPLILFEGVGVFQNFDAFFQYSKIEENNKFLLPSNLNGTNLYTPISLMQYRNFAVGGILNLMTFENQNSKINLFLNAGALYGRTGVKINENDSEGVFYNNLELPVELSLQILPEKRVSVLFSDRLSWFETFTENILINSIEDQNVVTKNRWLNSFNLDLMVDISTSGKLFLRYKLIHELDNINNNFSQLQFGYSFYILKNNGIKK